MHVLILPSWFPYDNIQSGNFIFDQAKALSRNKNLIVSVIDWGPNEYVLKIRKPIDSVKTLVHYLKSKTHVTKLASSLTIYKLPHLTWTSILYKGNNTSLINRITTLIECIESEQGKIDIIHAHVTFPAGYLGMETSSRLHIPYVITEHSGPFPLNEFKSKTGIRKILMEPLQKTSSIIAVSNWQAGSIKQYTNRNPIVIPNSVDVDFFKPPKKKKFEVTAFVLFTLSNLTPAKGIEDLLKACKILKNYGIDFLLRIGGKGKYLRAYQSVANDLNVSSNIVWLGSLSRPVILQEYQDCDIYVMPSRLESLSMVILEAMACGKPIIATACGGPQDLINKDNGILAEPANPASLANSIIQMINNYSDYNSSTIRQNCLENYSPKIITENIISVYNKVISGEIR